MTPLASIPPDPLSPSSSRLLAPARQDKLEALIREDGMRTVPDLARLLAVSEMTVRRDLNSLSRQGRLTRVHGGALAKSSLQFEQRLNNHSRLKKAVIKKITAQLPKVGSIYMDGSTTVFGLCDYIEAEDLQVTTNNWQTFQRLRSIPGVKAMILGGTLDSRTDNLVGALTRKSIQHLQFDHAFMACYGLGAQGFMEATLEDAEIKEIAAQQSRNIFLAVHHKKLLGRGAGLWNAPRENTVLVTDLSPGDLRLEEFQAMFTRVI